MNQVGIKGRFNAQIIESDGTISFNGGERDNLILDTALAFKDFPGPGTFLCIGSGAVTTPAVTDTALGNQIAAKAFSINAGTGNTSGPEGFHCNRRGTVTFGDLNTDVSEIGIRRDGVNGTLITRVLLKNAQGTPTPLTVGVGQTLKITYTIYYFSPYILSEGVMPTPHGDLHWRLQTYKQSKTQGAADTACKYVQNGFGLWSNILKSDVAAEAGQYDTLFSATNTLSPGKNVLELTSLYTKDVDTEVPAGRYLVRAYNENLSPTEYAAVLTQPYTIPAGHTFKFSLEFTWGRMP